MRVVVALVVVLGACRFGFDAGVPARDGAPSDEIVTTVADALVDVPLIDATLADAAPLTCPTDYVTLGGTSRYRWVDTSMTWIVAQQLCEADGQHLAVIDDATELAAVAGTLPSTNIWTGVTSRKAVGVFVKVTGGTATYLPWEAGEPDAEALECVELDGDSSLLADQDCISGRRPVCECDGLATDPSTY